MPPPPRIPACFADIVLDSLRGKWALHILRAIDRPEGRHFRAILRSIPGLSAKVLTQQLGHLVEAGVVRRITLDTPRQEVIYS